MELSEVYNEIKARLDTMDFGALWRGFRPMRFAVYNDTQCCLDGAYAEKTDEFIANTTIPYRGEHIAIWRVTEEPEDLDELASKLAHEMFHAFQTASGERRWANEVEALGRYRYSAENVSGRVREAALMRAVLEGDGARFSELLALRKARRERFPYEYGYEARIEQIEGSANFVELRALAALDAEKGARARTRLLERLGEAERYFPARPISYASGAALLDCICRCTDYDYEAFTDTPFAEGVLALAPAGAAAELTRDADVERLLADFAAETHAIVSRALEKGHVVLRGRYPLGSLNVYDARQEGRCAVSNGFVAYLDGGEQRSLTGDGAFVVELDGTDIITVYDTAS